MLSQKPNGEVFFEEPALQIKAEHQSTATTQCSFSVECTGRFHGTYEMGQLEDLAARPVDLLVLIYLLMDIPDRILQSFTLFVGSIHALASLLFYAY